MTQGTDRQAAQGQEQGPHDADAPRAARVRRPFVEPSISSPVDVLEATTFFQTVDSGGTGLRRKP